jgi:aminobenzoyl-glutamate utilization protein A
MHGVEAITERVGGSCAASSDAEMAALISDAASVVPAITMVRGLTDFKGSDDAAAMMRAVQQRGGRAVYFGLGTELKEVHHNPYFDFDEGVLMLGTELLVEAVRRCAAESPLRS